MQVTVPGNAPGMGKVHLKPLPAGPLPRGGVRSTRPTSKARLPEDQGGR